MPRRLTRGRCSDPASEARSESKASEVWPPAKGGWRTPKPDWALDASGDGRVERELVVGHGLAHSEVIADEFDQVQNSELGGEINRIINQGFQSRRPLVKCDGENNAPRPFKCFGPKIFALRSKLGPDVIQRILSHLGMWPPPKRSPKPRKPRTGPSSHPEPRRRRAQPPAQRDHHDFSQTTPWNEEDISQAPPGWEDD